MRRLKEGQEYSFRVEKMTSSPDNNLYFILTGPAGKKFLLPAERYSHYGISEGDILNCRIDRISCKGEVFLEPANPFYKEGTLFTFILHSFETRVNSSGDEVKVMLVRDIFDHLNPVAIDDSYDCPEPGSDIRLMVERISKGRLFIQNRLSKERDLNLKRGSSYMFTVERIAKGVDDKDYFIVKDKYGNTHTISRNYYEHYGFKQGTVFRGKIVKFRRDGSKIIEPDNPFYTTGTVMTFRVVSISENPVNGAFTVSLTDKFGFSHCVELPSRPDAEHLEMRLGMIRKGRPALEPM